MSKAKCAYLRRARIATKLDSEETETSTVNREGEWAHRVKRREKRRLWLLVREELFDGCLHSLSVCDASNAK